MTADPLANPLPVSISSKSQKPRGSNINIIKPLKDRRDRVSRYLRPKYHSKLIDSSLIF